MKFYNVNKLGHGKERLDVSPCPSIVLDATKSSHGEAALVKEVASQGYTLPFGFLSKLVVGRKQAG